MNSYRFSSFVDYFPNIKPEDLATLQVTRVGPHRISVHLAHVDDGELLDVTDVALVQDRKVGKIIAAIEILHTNRTPFITMQSFQTGVLKDATFAVGSM